MSALHKTTNQFRLAKKIRIAEGVGGYRHTNFMSLSNSHFPGLNILGGDYCRQNDVRVCGSQSDTAPRWKVGGDKKGLGYI